MLLIKLAHPADPKVLFATSATREEVLRSIAEYRKAEEDGTSYFTLEEWLREALPIVPVEMVQIHGYWADKTTITTLK